MSKCRSLISFYGLVPQLGGLKSLYKEFSDIAAENRVPINSVSIEPTKRNGYISVTKATARLDKLGFDNVETLDALALPSDSRSRFIDYSVNLSLSKENSYLSISGLVDILSLENQSLMKLAIRIIESFRPKYGYGCVLDSGVSPILYTLGLELYDPNIPTLKSGSPEYIKALTIARWADVGMDERIWESGVIRDVYPWNFLTHPHLEARVDGKTLKSWISSAKGERGSLVSISQAMTFWEVPHASIPIIRDALTKAGIVFSLERHLHYKAI